MWVIYVASLLFCVSLKLMVFHKHFWNMFPWVSCAHVVSGVQHNGTKRFRWKKAKTHTLPPSAVGMGTPTGVCV